MLARDASGFPDILDNGAESWLRWKGESGYGPELETVSTASWRTSNSASSVVERKKDSKAFADGVLAFTPLFLVIRKPFRLIMPRYLNWPSSALSPMSRDTK